jgi:hypothetical protein
VETLRSIGFDAAFNYKSRSVEEALDEVQSLWEAV